MTFTVTSASRAGPREGLNALSLVHLSRTGARVKIIVLVLTREKDLLLNY
jgi:hypothetical protein